MPPYEQPRYIQIGRDSNVSADFLCIVTRASVLLRALQKQAWYFQNIYENND
jgi:hypothetical protein